jgi:chromosomal replication initiation ATPase DnaA
MSAGGRPVQLVFDLSLPPALGPEDFVVAPGNAEAVAWLSGERAWPGPLLALYGPPGSGKSHLLALWAARHGAVRVTDIAASAARPGAQPLVIDDAAAAVAAAEEAMFHRINRAAGEGGRILLADAEPPSRWPVALPDLASRLRAAIAVPLAPPDDELLAQLLAKLFADRRLAVGPRTIGWLVPRMERSFAAARRIVAAVDRASLAEGRAPTLPFVRKVVAAL